MEESAGESEFQFLAGKVSAASRAGGTGKGGDADVWDCPSLGQSFLPSAICSFILSVSQLFVHFSHSLILPLSLRPPIPVPAIHCLPHTLIRSHITEPEALGPCCLASQDVSCIQRVLFLFYQWSGGPGVHFNLLTHPGIISGCLREQDSPLEGDSVSLPYNGKEITFKELLRLKTKLYLGL